MAESEEAIISISYLIYLANILFPIRSPLPVPETTPVTAGWVAPEKPEKGSGSVIQEITIALNAEGITHELGA